MDVWSVYMCRCCCQSLAMGVSGRCCKSPASTSYIHLRTRWCCLSNSSPQTAFSRGNMEVEGIISTSPLLCVKKQLGEEILSWTWLQGIMFKQLPSTCSSSASTPCGLILEAAAAANIELGVILSIARSRRVLCHFLTALRSHQICKALCQNTGALESSTQLASYKFFHDFFQEGFLNSHSVFSLSLQKFFVLLYKGPGTLCDFTLATR